MTGEPVRYKVTITNAQGLHMRPMKTFVELASKFQSTVQVYKQADQKIDGKSPWGLLSLGAEQGTELTLEVCGPDQQEALDALIAFLATLTDEDAPEGGVTESVDHTSQDELGGANGGAAKVNGGAAETPGGAAEAPAGPP
jgi:phosphotransferase system HPr (HPr) family protein